LVFVGVASGEQANSAGLVQLGGDDRDAVVAMQIAANVLGRQ
jgi:hypothetical protein